MLPSGVIPGTLKFCGALFWTAAYALIIRRTHRDRAPGMPLAALAGNVAIEATFGIWLRDSAPPHFPTVYLIWLLLDLVIVWQTWRYGPAYYRDVLPESRFKLTFLALFGAAFVLVWAVTFEFGDWDGRYSAFSVNVVMSSLFVANALRRSDVHGQSLSIASAKMLGTLSFTLLFVTGWSSSPLVLCLGVMSFCLDLTYIGLLNSRLRKLGLQPWRRV